MVLIQAGRRRTGLTVSHDDGSNNTAPAPPEGRDVTLVNAATLAREQGDALRLRRVSFATNVVTPCDGETGLDRLTAVRVEH